MNTDNDAIIIPVTGPEEIREIQSTPFMGKIFLAFLFKGMVRPKSIKPDARIPGLCLELNRQPILADRLARYREVCGFTQMNEQCVPISYFQMLFVGLLGKYLASDFFPITPMGLIHTFQSFDLKRPVRPDEILDLSCRLSRIIKTSKGLESEFTLDVRIKNELVWQGVSVFLTRLAGTNKTKKKPAEPVFLDQKEIISVPAGTGRKYATVSGDYNPHHLFNITAKAFGFKTAISHGMWSLARAVAGLESEFAVSEGPARVEAFFKRPVFMPAAVALGVEPQGSDGQENRITDFELRDEQTGIPHLKARLIQTGSAPDFKTGQVG